MHIPLYVYIIFFALLYIGINRCMPRVIKIQRLFVAPIIFTVLSVRGMVGLFEVMPVDIIFWITGGVLGMFLGYHHIRRRQVKADHQHQLIQLPGDWSMLVLILAIFGFEFFVHYSIDAGWTIASTITFKWVALTMLGVIAGMSIGRTLHYFLKYKKSTSETLVLQN